MSARLNMLISPDANRTNTNVQGSGPKAAKPRQWRRSPFSRLSDEWKRAVHATARPEQFEISALRPSHWRQQAVADTIMSSSSRGDNLDLEHGGKIECCSVRVVGPGGEFHGPFVAIFHEAIHSAWLDDVHNRERHELHVW
jgi:hypothetical protein